MALLEQETSEVGREARPVNIHGWRGVALVSDGAGSAGVSPGHPKDQEMPDDARPGLVAREGGEPDAPPSARGPVILDTS